MATQNLNFTDPYQAALMAGWGGGIPTASEANVQNQTMSNFLNARMMAPTLYAGPSSDYALNHPGEYAQQFNQIPVDPYTGKVFNAKNGGWEMPLSTERQIQMEKIDPANIQAQASMYGANQGLAGDIYRADAALNGDIYKANAQVGAEKSRPYFTDAGVDPVTGKHMIFNSRTGEFAASDVGGMLDPTKRKSLPTSAIDALQTFDSLLGTANRVMARQQADPSLTGPIEGRWNNLKSKFVDSPDFASFKRDMDSLIETSYALSGKQISEKEIRMLESLRGQINQPDANFGAAMAGYINWLEQKRQQRAQEYKNQGYMPYGENNQSVKPGVDPYAAPAPRQQNSGGVPAGAVRKQVDDATGAVRYLDANGNEVR